MLRVIFTVTLWIACILSTSAEESMELIGICPPTNEYMGVINECFGKHITNATETDDTNKKWTNVLRCIHVKYGIFDESTSLYDRNNSIRAINKMFDADGEVKSTLEKAFEKCFKESEDTDSARKIDQELIPICLLKSVEVICGIGEATKKGEKCYLIPSGSTPRIECAIQLKTMEKLKESQDHITILYELMICEAKKHGIADENGVLNQQAAIESLENTVGTDNITREELAKQREECFYKYSGDGTNMNEAFFVLHCLESSQRRICGTQLPEEKNLPPKERNCPSTPITQWEYTNCKHSAANVSDFANCFIERSGLVDEKGITSEERAKEYINHGMMPNQDRKDRLEASVTACFAAFDGTKQQSDKALQCCFQQHDRICGEPTEVPKSRCAVTSKLNSLVSGCILEAKSKVKPESSASQGDQIKRAFKICLYGKSNLIMVSGQVNQTAVKEFIEEMFQVNDQIKEELNMTVQQRCFDGYDNTPQEQYVTIDCIKKSLSKVCGSGKGLGFDHNQVEVTVSSTEEKIEKDVEKEKEKLESEKPEKLEYEKSGKSESKESESKESKTKKDSESKESKPKKDSESKESKPKEDSDKSEASEKTA